MLQSYNFFIIYLYSNNKYFYWELFEEFGNCTQIIWFIWKLFLIYLEI